MHAQFISLVGLASLVSFTSAGYGTCTSGGQGGECISTSTCSSNGGSSDPANLCPGGDDIQCCTYGSCTNGAGVAGKCVPTSTCSGSSDPGNFCPGSQDIQCCTTSSDPPPSSGCGVPKVNDATLTLLKDSESPQCSPTPYPDPNGNPTIGYGHLCQDSSCSDVKYSIPLSDADCDNLLQDDLVEYTTCTANAFADPITFNDNQFGAFVDFVYNEGCGVTTDPPFTRINDGDDPNTVVEEEFPKYVYGGGEKLPGLVTRRNNEIDLFETASSGKALPYTPC